MWEEAGRRQYGFMHNVEVWGEMGVGGGREERCGDRFLGRGKLGRDIMAICIMSKCRRSRLVSEK